MQNRLLMVGEVRILNKSLITRRTCAQHTWRAKRAQIELIAHSRRELWSVSAGGCRPMYGFTRSATRSMLVGTCSMSTSR
jgi:hypothetical protein